MAEDGRVGQVVEVEQCSSVCGSQASAFIALCLAAFGAVAEPVELCRLIVVKRRVKLAFARG